MKAFPDGYTHHIQGMDLRDYFAARAMQSFITLHEQALTKDGEPCQWYEDGTSAEIVSEQSYAIADAMMKARCEKI